MQELIEIALAVREELQEALDVPYLDGYCAIASIRLFKVLCEMGVTPELVEVENHVFLRVGETGYDITATQFDDTLPPVYVFEPDEVYGPAIFSSSNLKQFQEHLSKCCWPEEQVYEECDPRL